MTTWLAAGVGLALGALVVLLIDTQWWLAKWRGLRDKAAATQTENETLATRLAQYETDVTGLQARLKTESERIGALTEDRQGLQAELETAETDLKTLQDNMKRLSRYSEELETKLETSRGEQKRLEAQLKQATQDYELACQRLTAVESERDRLSQQGADVTTLQGEMAELRREKETAVAALAHAEQRADDLKAQNTGLVRQLANTKAIGQRLLALENKLEKQLKATRDQKRDSGAVRSAQLLDLTQIKGVGATYARRLEAAGFKSVVDIASASLDALSDAVGLSEAVVTEWQAQARSIVGDKQ